MKEKLTNSDACKWAKENYIGDDPELIQFLEDVRTKGDVAGRIYSLRTKLGMTLEDLSRLSGLDLGSVESIEESDYEGPWEEAIQALDKAFESWIAAHRTDFVTAIPSDGAVSRI